MELRALFRRGLNVGSRCIRVSFVYDSQFLRELKMIVLSFLHRILVVSTSFRYCIDGCIMVVVVGMINVALFLLLADVMNALITIAAKNGKDRGFNLGLRKKGNGCILVGILELIVFILPFLYL